MPNTTNSFQIEQKLLDVHLQTVVMQPILIEGNHQKHQYCGMENVQVPKWAQIN